MSFVEFGICQRMASLRKLYSTTLAYIFNFKCLKYVKLVGFRMLPDSYNYKKKLTNTNSHFLIECRESRFSPP